MDFRLKHGEITSLNLYCLKSPKAGPINIKSEQLACIEMGYASFGERKQAIVDSFIPLIP